MVEDCEQVMSQYMPENSVLFEGGTYQGKTLNNIINLADKIGKPFSEVYSLDSFEGLPEETKGIPLNKDWPAGAFNLAKDYNLTTVNQCMELVRSRVLRKDIHLVPGWFENTLTASLGNQLKGQIGFFHLDCDIFKSTKTLLDWAFTYNTLKEHCICRFDDWHGYMEWNQGQPLAFKLATDKYRVLWTPVCQNVFLYHRHNV